MDFWIVGKHAFRHSFRDLSSEITVFYSLELMVLPQPVTHGASGDTAGGLSNRLHILVEDSRPAQFDQKG